MFLKQLQLRSEEMQSNKNQRKLHSNGGVQGSSAPKSTRGLAGPPEIHILASNDDTWAQVVLIGHVSTPNKRAQ
eukprot:826770-Pelagomonas_calceolata.AAC.5